MTPEEFWKILHDISEPQPVFFRLYYDARNGRPLSYSMEDLPGTYITIDADTYRRSSFAVRVRDGKIVPVTLPSVPKIVHGTGTACHPKDVTIVVHADQPNQQWRLRSDQTD
jgi:hypothetical protein